MDVIIEQSVIAIFLQYSLDFEGVFKNFCPLTVVLPDYCLLHIYFVYYSSSTFVTFIILIALLQLAFNISICTYHEKILL